MTRIGSGRIGFVTTVVAGLVLWFGSCVMAYGLGYYHGFESLRKAIQYMGPVIPHADLREL